MKMWKRDGILLLRLGYKKNLLSSVLGTLSCLLACSDGSQLHAVNCKEPVSSANSQQGTEPANTHTRQLPVGPLSAEPGDDYSHG